MEWRDPELCAQSALRELMRMPDVLERHLTSLGMVRDGDRRWAHLAATSEVDAWLIAWGPGSGIPAHDHAASAAAIEVVHGELVEWSRARCALDLWSVRTIEPGTRAVVPPNRVHRVENDAACTAVSVHVYSPPLTAMTYHEELDAGAMIARAFVG